MPLTDLTTSERLIYQAYLQRDGLKAAQRWLTAHAAAKPGEPTKPFTFPKTLAGGGWQGDARKTESFRQEKLAALLDKVKDKEIWGSKATRLAADIIGPEWQERLGDGYFLVLLMVRSALEAHKRPGEPECNTYHLFSNYGTLGVLCAALRGRDSSYTTKTIQRWLSPTASHAAALRCWLGWRHWYTDSLLEYRRGVDPDTGKTFKTGQSRGPVIGGTLFRVRLTPLSDVSAERLKQCDNKRPSVIQPLKPELERDWRDLELDRHHKRTWAYGERTVRLEEIDVQIDTNSTKEITAKIPNLLFRDTNQTNAHLAQPLWSQNYLYPDIATETGAIQLRLDVEYTANLLLERLEGCIVGERWLKLKQRYRHAVWTAYKAHRYGETRAGYDQLKLAYDLAQEVSISQKRAEMDRKPFAIRDKAAFVWSVVEREGFAELRREYGGYQPGRYLRVFTTRMAKKLRIIETRGSSRTSA